MLSLSGVLDRAAAVTWTTIRCAMVHRWVDICMSTARGATKLRKKLG